MIDKNTPNNYCYDTTNNYRYISNLIYTSNQNVQNIEKEILTKEKFLELKKEAVKSSYYLYRLLFAALECGNTDNFYPRRTEDTRTKLCAATNKLGNIITDMCNCNDIDILRSCISDVISKVMCFFFSDELDSLSINSVSYNNICEDNLKENYSVIFPNIKFNKNNVTAFENVAYNFPTTCITNPGYVNKSLISEKKMKASIDLYGLRNVKEFPSFDLDYKNLYKKMLLVKDYSDIRMSQDFDIGILNLVKIPKYAYHAFETAQVKADFFFSNKHISKNGLMLIDSITYYLSFSDIMFFTAYLDNSDAVCSVESTTIVGRVAKKFHEKPEDAFNIVKKIISQEQSVKEYYITTRNREDVTFRSTEINVDSIEDALNDNAIQVQEINQRFFKQLDNDCIEKKRDPLLPFNPGQLGLVLVSGDIDGVIDEGDGHYHAIKGSVYREKVTTEEEPDKENERKTSVTYAVRTSVSVFLANGNLVELR